MIGGWNTGFGLALFYLLYLLLNDKLHYFIIYCINAEAAILQGYFTLRILVFESNSPIIESILKHHLASLVSILLPSCVFFLLVEQLSLHPILAQFFSTMLGIFLSYLMAKFFVFKANL